MAFEKIKFEDLSRTTWIWVWLDLMRIWVISEWIGVSNWQKINLDMMISRKYKLRFFHLKPSFLVIPKYSTNHYSFVSYIVSNLKISSKIFHRFNLIWDCIFSIFFIRKYHILSERSSKGKYPKVSNIVSIMTSLNVWLIMFLFHSLSIFHKFSKSIISKTKCRMEKIPSYIFNLYFHIAPSLFRFYHDCTETHCIAERAESGNWNCRTDNRILFVSKHFLKKLERLSGETRDANGVSMIVRNRTYYWKG